MNTITVILLVVIAASVSLMITTYFYPITKKGKILKVYNRLAEIAPFPSDKNKYGILICVEKNDIQGAYTLIQQGHDVNHMYLDALEAEDSPSFPNDKYMKHIRRKLYSEYMKHSSSERFYMSSPDIRYSLLDISRSPEMDRLLKYYGALHSYELEEYWLKRSTEHKKKELEKKEKLEEQQKQEKETQRMETQAFLDSVLL